jgi:hypothetical protein
MTDEDLDRSYTALCEALAAVGEANAPLFLAMMCLGLMARCGDVDEVLRLVATARAQCGADAGR